MTPQNEYSFEVRKEQPADPGKAQPLTYWRRVLEAIDGLGDGESLFFRHHDEEPTQKQLNKMRSNIAAQMKRHRPGKSFKIVSLPADRGVYVYATEMSPTANSPLEAAADPDWRDPAERRQMLLRGEVTPGRFEDPETPDPTGSEPANALEAEDDDLLAYPLQGEAPSFDEVADQVEAAIAAGQIVEVRDNPKTFRSDVCSCWTWWQATAVYKRGGPTEKGAHHHEACKLYSTWEALDTVAPCSCDGFYRELHPKRNARGEPEDAWYQPGDWHEGTCPRHVHRWKLPSAENHDPGTPFIGVCSCSATNEQQPYQTDNSDVIVDGRAKTSAGLTLARAPRQAVEAPLSTAPSLRRGPAKGTKGGCPKCGHGYNSAEHQNNCKGKA